jgi:two-component system, response regulator PdtaR
MSVKVLVVEDERILALSLKKKLEKLGFTVTGTASTGKEAIDSTNQEKPDLVLMDIVLKGEMDGIDTAKLIINLHEIPIIYLTAYADDETIERAVQTCPYGYIMKPYKDREIKANIEMALHKHKAEKEHFVDFEDIYSDVTRYINQEDKSIKKALQKKYAIEGPLSIDLGQKKIYISADRNNKESYNVFFGLVKDILPKILDSNTEIMVYSKGDELCLEFDNE